MTLASTLVRDSIVGDNWIQATAQAVPVQRVLGADGQPTGDILTGPVRLAFVDNLMELNKNATEGEDKYGCTALFTPLADFKIFYEEYYAACAREFPGHWDAQNQQYYGLHSPFHDQSEKARYGGYTPGCIFLNTSSLFRPSIVDSRHNPIVDKSKVYAGVWAILAVKPYGYGKNPRSDGKPTKKGIGFGLQTVMIIGDDTKFGGGAPDTKDIYKGVNITAPIVRPEMAQGMPAGPAHAPSPGVPGYMAPGGGAPQPGQPPQGFNMPQQTYTPAPAQPPMQQPPQGYPTPGAPAAPGYPPGNAYAPGAPTAPAPGATTYPSNGYNPNDPMFQG